MRGPGPAQLDFVVGRAPIALQLLYIHLPGWMAPSECRAMTYYNS